MTKETLEEAAENEASIFYEKGTIEWNKYRQVFELGAKWQAEIMYSEEEIILAIKNSYGFKYFSEKKFLKNLEQFKKKNND